VTVQVLEQVQEQVQVEIGEQDFDGFAAPPLRWEPCGSVSAVSVLDEHGLCAGCGWPHADHDDAAGTTGALVIPVPRRERPRLRRAS
jgi:hypothetical protein